MTKTARLCMLAAVIGVASCGESEREPTWIHVGQTTVDLVLPYGWEDPLGAPQCLDVTYEGDGVVAGYPPGVAPANWLAAYTHDLGPGHASLCLVANTYGMAYGPGRHATTVRVATGRSDGSDIQYVDLDVALTIPQVVEPARAILRVGTGDAPVSRVLNLTGDGIAWTATTLEPWMTVEPSSGVGSGPLTFRFDPRTMAAGEHGGLVRIRDLRTGIETYVVVHVSVDPAGWQVAQPAVGLWRIGARSSLERSVRVTANTATSDRWTATTAASWLHLDAASGAPGDPLVLRADPAGLADGTYTTTVTLATEGGGGPDVTTVSVGLYLDGASTVLDTADVPATSARVAMDPLRPWLYMAAGTEGVAVLNVYTGVLAPSLAVANLAADVRAVTVTGDGSRLYALAEGGLVYPVDLATGTASAPLTGASGLETRYHPHLEWLRVCGYEFLLASTSSSSTSSHGDFRILALPSGEEAVTDLLAPNLAEGIIDAGDGAAFVRDDWTLTRWELRARAGELHMLYSALFEASWYFNDQIVPAGDRVLLVGSELRALDAVTLAATGPVVSLEPSNATCLTLPDGRVLCAMEGFDQAARQFVTIGPDLVQSRFGATYTGNISHFGALAVTGDGQRLAAIVYTQDPHTGRSVLRARLLDVP